MAADSQKELFASLISDIRNYEGHDPLRPWLQAIRRMKESLPSSMLEEKLPRFLQKCAETFEADRRYRNDSRYLRVWILLMDYVDDAKPVLRRMEKNQIGLKQAMFYSAYALYYEKRKKFDEAEKMYHLGVQNLAEPVGELQKLYEQFVHRMELYKKQKAERAMSKREKLASRSMRSHEGVGRSRELIRRDGDDTVVVKFVGSAIVGKSEAEDACHHGLVDPTVNMKEAMNAISSMFREPLEQEPTVRRRPHLSKPKLDNQSNKFEVFIDNSLGEGENVLDQKLRGNDQNAKHLKLMNSDILKKPTETKVQEPFILKILTDDDDDSNDYAKGDHLKFEKNMQAAHSANCVGGSKLMSQKSEDAGLKEDTVIRRFVGSTVLGESKVENACHSGLVDPTINLKEAIKDINSMFGQPLNILKVERQKKHVNLVDQQPTTLGFCILTDDDLEEGSKSQASKVLLDQKPATQGFHILADDDLEQCPNNSQGSSNIPPKISKNDLFEPTFFTQEAMADINEMFGRPLDF